MAVVAARPNFVKMAPVVHALRDRGLEVKLLHTGQHYDPVLSGELLEQLAMPAPDENLEVGSGSHAEQVAKVLVGVERSLRADPVHAVVVAGDVNSTMAAALAAAKLGVPIVHVESGLRSRDWTMPEEINRVITDRISDLLLCTSEDATVNLAGEGIGRERVALVGNTMIDSLQRLSEQARQRDVLDRLDLTPHGYALVTLHRPALVDDAERLGAVLGALGRLGRELPVVFPVHPRTRARLGEAVAGLPDALRLLEPLGYLEFLTLEQDARLVITDSGGVQEETSALGVPCLTYRSTTERPVTVELGTNRLVGTDPDRLLEAAREVLERPADQPAPPIPLWDGAAGPRAAAAIEGLLRGDPPPLTATVAARVD